MNAQEFIELEDRYGAHNYHPLDVVLTRGKGVWVYDTDGKKYLDCLSSYSALNQGHCHPRLVKVMQEQAEKLTLTSRAFRNDQLGPFCKEICELAGYEAVLPMNSGAEAVETALKAARKWGHKVKGIPEGKAEIITMSGNFHGRTISIISFSTEDDYKDGFGPFTPNFISVPYGDFDALEKAVNPNTAAILVEPIQGEGGIVVPPDGYLRKISELCKKNRVLFIADEIQTGLGRTGKLFACDHEGVKPDAMCLGKALAGGCYPVSVFLASHEVMDVFRPGDHGSTFGGNPMGMALARTAIRILTEEKLIDNAVEQGEYFMKRLRDMNSQYIELVRGKGLLIGVVLKDNAGGDRRFCEELQERGILCEETHYNIIRFAPPLVITREEIDWAMEQIEAVLK